MGITGSDPNFVPKLSMVGSSGDYFRYNGDNVELSGKIVGTDSNGSGIIIDSSNQSITMPVNGRFYNPFELGYGVSIPNSVEELGTTNTDSSTYSAVYTVSTPYYNVGYQNEGVEILFDFDSNISTRSYADITVSFRLIARDSSTFSDEVISTFEESHDGTFKTDLRITGDLK